MPIRCHFRDCKSAPGHVLSCKQRYIKYRTFTVTFYAAFRRNWIKLVRWQCVGLSEFKRDAVSSRRLDQQHHVWTLYPQPRPHRRLPDPDFCAQPSRRGTSIRTADDRSATDSLSCSSVLSAGTENKTERLERYSHKANVLVCLRYTGPLGDFVIGA